MRSAPALVIFDLDGTLIDSNPDITTAVNRTLAELGLSPRSADEVRAYVGDGATRLVERVLPEALRPRLAELVVRFREHYAAVCTDDTRPYDGVDALLEALGDWPLALATNKPASFLPAILARFGWTERFDPVLGGDSLPTFKPDPAMLLACCERHVVEPSRALMVGDGAQDLEAARRAGMPACAVTWGFRPRALLEEQGPAYLIDAPLELLALL